MSTAHFQLINATTQQPDALADLIDESNLVDSDGVLANLIITPVSGQQHWQVICDGQEFHYTDLESIKVKLAPLLEPDAIIRVETYSSSEAFRVLKGGHTRSLTSIWIDPEDPAFRFHPEEKHELNINPKHGAQPTAQPTA